MRQMGEHSEPPARGLREPHGQVLDALYTEEGCPNLDPPVQHVPEPAFFLCQTEGNEHEPLWVDDTSRRPFACDRGPEGSPLPPGCSQGGLSKPMKCLSQLFLGHVSSPARRWSRTPESDLALAPRPPRPAARALSGGGPADPGNGRWTGHRCPRPRRASGR